MRRLFAWLAGAAGGAAAVEALRRRGARPAPASPAELPAPDPRAEELRAKLAQAPVETVAEATAETTEPEPEPEAELMPEDPQERRKRVHEQGRSALDEIRRTDS
jgi:hypothetical protein